MTSDIIEKIEDATIQHGNSNNRIYIMKITTDNVLPLIKSTNKLAKKNNYSKIFAKIHPNMLQDFIADGFQQEAFIKGYFNGKEDALLLGKFLTDKRASLHNEEDIKSIISIAKGKKQNPSQSNKKKYKIIECTKNDTKEITEIYKIVFKTYPFPIHNENYIKQTMDTHIKYYAAIENNKIVGLSSAEIDKESQSVEMTDFATLPEYLGNGIALQLLQEMEVQMSNENILTAYTIARAESLGMNITFAKNNYAYTGTLINNTNISGKIESMNVWCKSLKPITNPKK